MARNPFKPTENVYLTLKQNVHVYVYSNAPDKLENINIFEKTFQDTA